MFKTIPLAHPYLEITPNVLVGNVVIAPRLHEKPFPGVAFYPDGNPIEALYTKYVIGVKVHTGLMQQHTPALGVCRSERAEPTRLPRPTSAGGPTARAHWSGWVRKSNTPRSENNTNFSGNAQEKSSDSRWSERCTAIISGLSELPTTTFPVFEDLQTCFSCTGIQCYLFGFFVNQPQNSQEFTKWY